MPIRLTAQARSDGFPAVIARRRAGRPHVRCDLDDPDGNGWLLQEIAARLPDR